MTYKAKILTWAFWLTLAASCGTLSLFAGITLYLGPQLPEVETLRQIKLQTPLRVYSRDGLLIGEFGEQRRNPISIENVPKAFIDAILSAEDDRFYSHHGVDIKGLLRAASQLLQSGHIQTGGSTITMQVARNFFLTRKQTFSRKFNEILLALQIEKELTKAEILELYVNKIYLGNRAYGVEAAARVYYGKSINDLNLAQLAMIAGLPKAPSAYNPLANAPRALIRRDWILGRMLSLGYIDQDAYDEAVAQPVTASFHGSRLELSAPYIAEMARKEAVDKLGLAAYTDGFRIYTTIDSKLQQHAQQAVVNGLLSYDKRHGYRGPEAKLPLVMSRQLGSTPSPVASETGATTLTNALELDNAAEVQVASTPEELSQATAGLPLQEWQQALGAYKTVGGLSAAVVTQVHDDNVDILIANGTQTNIGWEHGLSEAKPYISENRFGFAPKSAAEVLSVGDVIRVFEHQDGHWELSQIPTVQGALVSLDPSDGAIKALVGGFDFGQSHFNRATQAERQPGSVFKPFIYASALENGFTPATIINDAPIVFDDPSLENTWRPENDSGKFLGPTRLRQALFTSRNLVSIRILRSIGIDTAIAGMDRYGFDKTKMPRNLSLALGTSTMTPLQLATGYTVLANGGYKVEAHLIDRIDNVDGETIFNTLPATVCRECEAQAKMEAARLAQKPSAELGDHDSVLELEQAMAAELANELLSLQAGAEAAVEADAAPDPAAWSLLDALSVKGANDSAAAPSTTAQDSLQAGLQAPLKNPVAPRVVSEQVVYLINDILRDVIQKGTGRRAKVLGREDLAGKTGTTNGPTDLWFSGYNRNIVTTTWMGFDQNTNLGRYEYGSSAALPIWIEFMEEALKDIPPVESTLPDGLVSIRIDPNTGKRAQPNQSNAIFETFRADTLPGYGNDESPSMGDDSDNSTTLPEDLF